MAESERLGASFSIDVSGLKAGLQQANRLIRESNSEFKAAAAGLDDWSASEAGLTAKLKNLNEVADLQRKKIDALQKEYDDCIANGLDPMSAAAVKMRTDINNEKAAFEKTQSEIKKYSEKLDNLADASDDAGDSMDDLSDSTEEAGESAETASGGFTVMKGALANLVAEGLRKAIDATKEFAKSMITTAAEVKAENSQYAQTFGEVGDAADAMVDRVAASTGIVRDRLTGSAANIFAFARSSGASTEEAMALTESALTAAADSAAYYDKSLEDSTETLQSFLKGNFANDAALGVSATEFTRNAKATELFGKKYNELSEVQKQQTLLKMVTDAQELSGAMGQASRESDGWENVMGNLDETWRQFKANVGTPFLEAIIPVIQEITSSFKEWADGIDWDAFKGKISEIADAIKTGFGWIKDNGNTIIAVLAGIAAGFAAFKVATMIMSVVSAIKKAGGALALLNTTMLASPITWIAVGVAALVAGIVLLIKNWDKVKEAGVAAWEWIKGAWESAATWFNDTIIQPVADFFSELWKSVTDAASAAWEGIKSVFSAVVGWFDENIVQPFINSTFFKIVTELAEGVWIAIKRIWEVVSAWFNENVITPLTDFFTKTWNAIKDKAKAAWDGIVGVWKSVSGWFKDKVITPVTSAFDKAWTTLKNGASKAWEGIKSVFSKVASFFGDTFSKAWEKVKAVFSVGGKIFDGIKDGIVSAFKTVVNAIIKGINKVVALPFNAINKALDTIRNISFLGISPFEGLLSRISVPEIPLLAKGGVVKQATAAVVGEDGAEAVVPLERNTEWIDKIADKLASKQQKSVIVNQTNNYAQAHSRYELYKSKQQTAAAVRLALQGG